MRILLLTAVAFCLVQAGCQTSSRGARGPARTNGNSNTPAPFLGTPPGSSPAASEPLASGGDSGSLASAGPTVREGVLAGRILDQDSRLRPGAIIQVIDLEAAREGAPLSVKANREGYFDINGLEAGRSYRLIARVKDGSRTLVGSTRVVPPNVRVAIFLNDEVPGDATATSGTAPVVPAPPGEDGPAASLGAPIRNPGNGVTTPLPGSPEVAATPPVPPAVSTTDSTLIGARDRVPSIEEGSHRDAPTVTLPGPPNREHNPEKPAVPPVVPPPPPGATPGEIPPAEMTPAPPSAAVQAGVPRSRTVVPSCVRVGHRVENIALYDVQGGTFELAKDRRGRLILLDFWFTDCGPCRRAIPKLNYLQNKYGQHGLEVIGITYEQGTLAEKQQALEQARQRYRLAIQYRLVFGGGGGRKCPVAEQLEVDRFPTLILLDEQGRILWRGQGLDEYAAYQLERAIYDRLFSRRVVGR